MPTQKIYRNIVGRNMLRGFGHSVRCVATCCVLLAQVCKWSHLSQQHPTCRNKMAKRAQHIGPNNVAICCVGMLRWFGWGLNLKISKFECLTGRDLVQWLIYYMAVIICNCKKCKILIVNKLACFQPITTKIFFQSYIPHYRNRFSQEI